MKLIDKDKMPKLPESTITKKPKSFIIPNHSRYIQDPARIKEYHGVITEKGKDDK